MQDFRAGGRGRTSVCHVQRVPQPQHHERCGTVAGALCARLDQDLIVQLAEGAPQRRADGQLLGSHGGSGAQRAWGGGDGEGNGDTRQRPLAQAQGM